MIRRAIWVVDVANGSIGDYEIATAIALQTTGTSSRSSDWLR